MMDYRTPIDTDMDWGADNFLVSQISCGWQFTCALSTEGEVRCRGMNHYRLGRDGVDGNSPETFIIGNGDDEIRAIVFGLDGDLTSAFVPKKISTGTDHACAVSTNGYLKCW